MIGKYTIDSQLMSDLHNIWNNRDTTVVWATDGGLKDKVGTSSYALFFPNNPIAILYGRAAEYQPHSHASSTRQELLGQLGAKYWMRRLQKKWGRPRHKPRVILVTDSQASIDIMENLQNVMGLKHVLKPDMDIALELAL